MALSARDLEPPADFLQREGRKPGLHVRLRRAENRSIRCDLIGGREVLDDLMRRAIGDLPGVTLHRVICRSDRPAPAGWIVGLPEDRG